MNNLPPHIQSALNRASQDLQNRGPISPITSPSHSQPSPQYQTSQGFPEESQLAQPTYQSSLLQGFPVGDQHFHHPPYPIPSSGYSQSPVDPVQHQLLHLSSYIPHPSTSLQGLHPQGRGIYLPTPLSNMTLQTHLNSQLTSPVHLREGPNQSLDGAGSRRPPPQDSQSYRFDSRQATSRYGPPRQGRHYKSNYETTCRLQSAYLNYIIPRIIREVAMTTSELKEKEIFRVKLEKTVQSVVADFARTNGIININAKGVKLLCYGSLGNGFAIKNSDMDLLFSLPTETKNRLGHGMLGLQRALEKTLLDLGIGARLLTKTRVPILRICESPSPELYKALVDEHEKSETEGFWDTQSKDPPTRIPQHFSTDHQMSPAVDGTQDQEASTKSSPGQKPKVGRRKWNKLDLTQEEPMETWSVSPDIVNAAISSTDDTSRTSATAEHCVPPIQSSVSRDSNTSIAITGLESSKEAERNSSNVPGENSGSVSQVQASTDLQKEKLRNPAEKSVPGISLDSVGAEWNFPEEVKKLSISEDGNDQPRSTTNGSDKDATVMAQPSPATADSLAQLYDPLPPKAPTNLGDRPGFRDTSHLEFPKEGVGIQCDINFTNHIAIHNTHLLRCYSLCDNRVRDLGLFVKAWAKKRKINSPYHGTLSSYGYTLMLLHYLINVADPPVLPNLHQAYQDPPPHLAGKEVTTVDGFDIRFFKDEKEIIRRRDCYLINTNRHSYGTLLRGFFEYYSSQGPRWRPQFNWTHEVISIRTRGGILYKNMKGWTEAKSTESGVRLRYLLAIEDPFETGHNIARTVIHNGIVAIRDEFRRAYKILCRIEDVPGCGWQWRDDDGCIGEDLFNEAEDRVGLQKPRGQSLKADAHASATESVSAAVDRRYTNTGQEVPKGGVIPTLFSGASASQTKGANSKERKKQAKTLVASKAHQQRCRNSKYVPRKQVEDDDDDSEASPELVEPPESLKATGSAHEHQKAPAAAFTTKEQEVKSKPLEIESKDPCSKSTGRKIGKPTTMEKAEPSTTITPHNLTCGETQPTVEMTQEQGHKVKPSYSSSQGRAMTGFNEDSNSGDALSLEQKQEMLLEKLQKLREEQAEVEVELKKLQEELRKQEKRGKQKLKKREKRRKFLENQKAKRAAERAATKLNASDPKNGATSPSPATKSTPATQQASAANLSAGTSATKGGRPQKLSKKHSRNYKGKNQASSTPSQPPQGGTNTVDPSPTSSKPTSPSDSAASTAETPLTPASPTPLQSASGTSPFPFRPQNVFFQPKTIGPENVIVLPDGTTAEGRMKTPGTPPSPNSTSLGRTKSRFTSVFQSMQSGRGSPRIAPDSPVNEIPMQEMGLANAEDDYFLPSASEDDEDDAESDLGDASEEEADA